MAATAAASRQEHQTDCSSPHRQFDIKGGRVATLPIGHRTQKPLTWREEREARLDRLRWIVRARRAGQQRGGLWTALGLLLLVGAVFLAMQWMPNGPRRSSAPRPRQGPVTTEPQGEVGDVTRFAWQWPGAERAFEVQVLDAEFAEVARLGPTDAGATSLSMPVDLRQRLLPGGVYHWVVESLADGELVRSRVASFCLPPR